MYLVRFTLRYMEGRRVLKTSGGAGRRRQGWEVVGGAGSLSLSKREATISSFSVSAVTDVMNSLSDSTKAAIMFEVVA